MIRKSLRSRKGVTQAAPKWSYKMTTKTTSPATTNSKHKTATASSLAENPTAFTYKTITTISTKTTPKAKILKP